MKVIEPNQKRFALVVASVLCVAIFSVIVGQALWSDIITFEKNGDNLKQCFPSMLKVVEYLKSGVLWGVDTGTFNGATEFFNRSNMSNMYLPMVFFGFLSSYIPDRLSYLLLYILQMFICSYFSVRLAQRFFSLDKKRACLFTCSIVVVALYESWYLSHYFVATLLCPALYAGFKSLDDQRKCVCILYAFSYVLCFTSGYIITSVALAIFVLLGTVIYGLLWKKELGWKIILKRSWIPFMIGGGVSFLYCLQLLLYVRDVVNSASSTISDALYFKLSTVDLKRIFSANFLSEAPIEQLPLITLGAFWLFIIAVILRYNTISKMQKKEQILFKMGIMINVIILGISLGEILPFALWFYSFVPVFGSMHLPMRYLMITLSIFYLGLTISTYYIPDLKNSKEVLRLSIISLGIVGILIIIQNNPLMNLKIDSRRLIIEFVLISLIFYFIYRYGLMERCTVALCCFFILLPGLTFFNESNEILLGKQVIIDRSIVYNMDEQDELDTFISALPEKDRYLYAAFDSVENVPDFLPGNYEWYGYSRHNLSNYMGYELQLSLPKDYLKSFPWFNQLDWRYIADTRGDFIVLDEKSIQDNKAILDIMVDWEKSNRWLNDIHRICMLKKFIPLHYTGRPFVQDNLESLDNGYFYVYGLSNQNLIDFSTNDATYYKATIRSDAETSVTFLLYPNRFYHYYVNGEEIKPDIDNMRVYLPISKGINYISVNYENVMAKVSVLIFVFYYTICLVVSVFYISVKVRKEFNSKGGDNGR